MDVLQSDKLLAKIDRAYDVHPLTVPKWKQHFAARGAKVFGGKGRSREDAFFSKGIDNWTGRTNSMNPESMSRYT